MRKVYIGTILVVLTFGLVMLSAQDVQDEAIEEEVIEAEETIVEEVFEEAEESVNPLDGFAVGLNVGLPIVKGAYLEGQSGINFGLLIGTPYGLPLGPLNIGVGVEVLSYSFPDADFNGMAVLGTFNVGLNDLLVFPATLPVQFSAQVGAGLYGGGFGATIGGAVDIPLEKFNVNLPLAVKLYGRGNVMSDAGEDSGIAGEPTGWVNAGMMITYDVSTLF